MKYRLITLNGNDLNSSLGLGVWWGEGGGFGFLKSQYEYLKGVVGGVEGRLRSADFSLSSGEEPICRHQRAVFLGVMEFQNHGLEGLETKARLKMNLRVISQLPPRTHSETCTFIKHHLTSVFPTHAQPPRWFQSGLSKVRIHKVTSMLLTGV